MIKRAIFYILVLIPSIFFGQGLSDTLGKNETKPKVGYRFYIKTEFLNTALRALFARPTYDIDVQLAVRLNNHFHFVNTYGKTTFYITDTIQSQLRSRVYFFDERSGTSFHRSSSMVRYYPFNRFDNLLDYLFVEGGIHFQLYKGITNAGIYDSTKLMYETQYIHHIDIYRYGPQLNIGLSHYFQRLDPIASVKPKIIFSPEIFLGIYYNGIYIIRDEVTNLIGITPNGYNERKIRFTLRLKLGIGFL